MPVQIRKAIFTVCVAIGFMVGFNNGTKHPAPVRTCQPATSECIAKTALDGPTHEIYSGIGGMLVGGAIGFGLAMPVGVGGAGRPCIRAIASCTFLPTERSPVAFAAAADDERRQSAA
jgi:hypothetical protein